jgi:hypothetical protein
MAQVRLTNPLKKLAGEAPLSKTTRGRNPRRLNLPQKAIVKNIIFTEYEVWAFYRMSAAQYDFESIDSKTRLITQASEAYASLTTLGGMAGTVHIMPFTIPTPTDTEGVIATAYNHAQSINNPKYDEIMRRQKEWLDNHNYLEHHAYLGVKLGDRRDFTKSFTEDESEEVNIKEDSQLKKNIIETGVEAEKIIKNYALLVGAYTDNVTRLEILNASQREREVGRALRLSALHCEPLSRDEIMLVTKAILNPGEGALELDIDEGLRVGEAELAHEYVHSIDNSKNKYLKIKQEYLDGESTNYVATFTIKQLPEILEFPHVQPLAETAKYAVDEASFFARMAIVPATEMAANFTGQEKLQNDEAGNIQYADENTQNYGDQAITSLQDARSLLEKALYLNSHEGTPWVRGSFHIRVYSKTVSGLKEQYAKLKQQYKAQNITLLWDRNAQLGLYLSAIPGSSLFVGGKANNHILSQQFSGLLGINFVSEVGDSIDLRAKKRNRV